MVSSVHHSALHVSSRAPGNDKRSWRVGPIFRQVTESLSLVTLISGNQMLVVPAWKGVAARMKRLTVVLCKMPWGLRPQWWLCTSAAMLSLRDMSGPTALGRSSEVAPGSPEHAQSPCLSCKLDLATPTLQSVWLVFTPLPWIKQQKPGEQETDCVKPNWALSLWIPAPRVPSR